MSDLTFYKIFVSFWSTLSTPSQASRLENMNSQLLMTYDLMSKTSYWDRLLTGYLHTFNLVYQAFSYDEKESTVLHPLFENSYEVAA